MSEGNRSGYTSLRDMFDGGGPGRSGDRFEGGGMISSLGNAMGGPSMFGFNEGGGDTNRGAQIGRTVGGMMFGPLGFVGGGLLGNMLGGRGRGSEMAPTASEVPMQRPAAMPASVAAAAAPTRPQMRPEGLGMFPVDLPPATLRFIEQYGLPMGGGYAPPPLPGTVMMDAPMMPGAMPPPVMSMPGAMPQPSMGRAPVLREALQSLPIDRATGRPMAMMPPRIGY
jgi:hypothetical protein